MAAVMSALAFALPFITAFPQVHRWMPRLAGRGRPGHVALTFDDGPDPCGTPEILDILARLEVKATFFMLGEQVAKHPDVAQRVVAEGHEIALHGWDHRNSLLVPPRRLRASLVRASDEIAAATGVRPVWYRPPYGIPTGATFWASRSLGLMPVLWDACGRDWREDATAEEVVRDVMRDARDGSTVLLHDSDYQAAPGSWKVTAAALEPLVVRLRELDLTVGPLRNHMARH
ncbi:polysaccharide deacetylase family protein [Mycobacterium sp. E740]|uniref:polysaccharide deacetylase family protein n=1 Tax=Mycobacterium sp. E740 TaxID=1834149 RepID=UPI0018D41C6D|nr:polysaccharide deacetylase family protein [Mycobacterium sp. E740]